MRYDLIVVGGGLVGLATAYKYSLKYPGHRIAVLEKERKWAFHQSGRNSGVIHSGIYYKPGSYKARNCVEGRKQLVEFCEEHDVAYEICGKIILATSQGEADRLPGLLDRAKANGLDGVRQIGPDEIREIEPFAEGPAALFVPQTGIVDYKGMASRMADLIRTRNTHNRLFLDHPVVDIKDSPEGKILITPSGEMKAAKVVFCTGLQSDRMARLDGLRPEVHIVGFRGDYFDLTDSGKKKVRNLIYPVPNPTVPFLGVHFTRMYDGEVECGPNAVFSFKREGYSRTAFDLHDTAAALAFAGTWRLFRSHWKFGLGEYQRAFSKSLFLKALQGLIPSLESSDLKPGRSGVRAQALDKDGKMVDDFYWEEGKNSLHVINAPSPAATACLSIGDEIVDHLEKMN